MPDESCRKCGGALYETEQCAECLQSTSMECGLCGAQAAERPHYSCTGMPEIAVTQASIGA